jgi:hypothetical protein
MTGNITIPSVAIRHFGMEMEFEKILKKAKQSLYSLEGNRKV